MASFFVSRVDTLVDQELQAIVEQGGPQAEAARARLGTAAIDNAKLAYEVFQQTFSGAALGGAGRPGGAGSSGPCGPRPRPRTPTTATSCTWRS